MADVTDPRDPNALTWTDFERDLVALARSPRTIQSYREAAQQLADHAKGVDLVELTKTDVQAYLIEVRDRHSGTAAQVRFRSLHRDVDRMQAQVTVRGKGSKWRHVDYSIRTGKALAKYLRVRQKHELANLDVLWLGSRGMALTPNGVTQMIRRRCRQAGIGQLHPHQFRHWSASEHFTDGFSDQDAMRRFGWSSLEMPRRYGSATGARRALDHARVLAMGDRL